MTKREKQINKFLIDLGGNPSLKGFRLVEKISLICLEDEIAFSNFEGFVYPKLGLEKVCVLRAVSYFINDICLKRNRYFEKIFGETLKQRGNITVKTFIGYLINHIKSK